MIRVYPLPPQLFSSPYLDQLYAPMAAHGVDVRRVRPRHALPALLLGSGPRILHLHFFDELTQRPSRMQTAARSLLFLALLAALRLRGVCIVWTAHNLEPHELYHPTWGFMVYRFVTRWSAAIIAHSQAARDLLETRYGPLPHCVVIPHGSYVGLYGPPRDRAESRAALGLPADGPVLLNLGTLRPYKNIEGLIDAFGALPPAMRGTLLIAGAAKSPTYTEALRQRAEGVPGVRLRATFIPDAELPTYLAAADLVALPYRSLLTSGILLWALSYARPVVAPAFGPVCELVREGQEGFLFTPGDIGSLRAALERAMAHPNLDALGAAGLEIAREFAWPRIAERTTQLYRGMTNDERRKGTIYRAPTNDEREPRRGYPTEDRGESVVRRPSSVATDNGRRATDSQQYATRTRQHSAPAQPLVSLIVVAYNSAALLPAFFAALATTKYTPYEVLVVDNASSDGTPRLLVEQYPQARVLANSENMGFGRACNQGARAARGDLLVFLNPDVIVTPDWLTILVRHAADYPDAAIICPTTLYPDEPVRVAAAPVEETAAVPGCAMMMPHAAWRALNGFDEQIFLYWEDTELCWRAWLLGWRVLADLESYVYHERGASAGGQRWDAERTKNSLYTYLKLMRWRRAAPFALLLAAKTLIKLARWRRPELLTAWAWNFRHLGSTLAQRRAVLRHAHGDPADLERRIAAHTRRGRAARQERKRMVYYSAGKR